MFGKLKEIIGLGEYDEEFDEVEFPDEQEEESYDDEYEGVEEDE